MSKLPECTGGAPRTGSELNAGLRAGLLVMLASVLTACATRGPSRPVLEPAAQEALLRDLSSFSLNGRTAVRAAGDGVTASMAWTQREAETVIRLSGPFGAGGLTVTWSPDSLRLAGGKDEVFENEEAEAVLLDQLGFVPPFDALRYWVLGLDAPGEPAAQRIVDESSGRLQEITQQGWRIRYREWMRASASGGSVQMPRNLIVTRDDLWLRVVVQKWKL